MKKNKVRRYEKSLSWILQFYKGFQKKLPSMDRKRFIEKIEKITKINIRQEQTISSNCNASNDDAQQQSNQTPAIITSFSKDQTIPIENEQISTLQFSVSSASLPDEAYRNKQVPFQYIIIGETRTFFSRETNLMQKLEEKQNLKQTDDQLIDNEQKNISNQTENQNVDSVPSDIQEDMTDLFTFDNGIRYFCKEKNAQQKICRRCKQPGHYERMCLIESKLVCFTCLGDHLQYGCPQRVCFNCNAIGHMNRDCLADQSKRCLRCLKYGHLKEDCGGVVFPRVDKYHNRSQCIEFEWQKTDDQKLKCFVCKKKGHYRCEQTGVRGEVDDIVYGKRFQKNIRKLREEEERRANGLSDNFSQNRYKSDQDEILLNIKYNEKINSNKNYDSDNYRNESRNYEFDKKSRKTDKGVDRYNWRAEQKERNSRDYSDERYIQYDQNNHYQQNQYQNQNHYRNIGQTRRIIDPIKPENYYKNERKGDSDRYPRFNRNDRSRSRDRKQKSDVSNYDRRKR